MTEYWVSQGNKWCDFCKIYIANNPLSIRTHELGQRHKDSVAKRLASMRKESAAKEKEQKEAARALEQIEAKAKRSYQKDLAAFRDARNSNALASEASGKVPDASSNDQLINVLSMAEWEYDTASGYYYDQASGFHYDPNSGLYYSDTIGKWLTEEHAFASSQVLSSLGSRNSSELKHNESDPQKSLLTSGASPLAEDKATTKSQSGPPPGLVVSSSLNPMRSVKGSQSSIAVNKRKRVHEKPKVVSKEEEAALRAREAARKRMDEREKPLLGLHKSY